MALPEYEKSIRPEFDEALKTAFINQYLINKDIEVVKENGNFKSIILIPLYKMSKEDALTVAKIENWHRAIPLDHDKYEWVEITRYGLASRPFAQHPMILFKNKETGMQDWFGVSQHLTTHSYNFLISKGYALPFMGYSVEKFYDEGWINFK